MKDGTRDNRGAHVRLNWINMGIIWGLLCMWQLVTHLPSSSTLSLNYFIWLCWCVYVIAESNEYNKTAIGKWIKWALVASIPYICIFQSFHWQRVANLNLQWSHVEDHHLRHLHQKGISQQPINKNGIRKKHLNRFWNLIAFMIKTHCTDLSWPVCQMY